MLEKENYRPRLIDPKIEQNMKVFGAVNLIGAKACGKTSSGEYHTKQKVCIASSDGEYSSRTIAQINPSLILKDTQRPCLIDEWQELPQIWDAVRFECDNQQQAGQFILTGSSATSGMIHSGAGRIVDIRMLTMSIYEMGLSAPKTVSLNDLFDKEGDVEALFTGDITLSEIINFVGQGGWPKLVILKDQDLTAAGQTIASGYLNAVIERDVKKVGGFKRTPKKEAIIGLLKAIAINDSKPATNQEYIASAKALSGANISVNTVPLYLEIFENLYLIEDQDAFNSPAQTPRVLMTSPKHRFVDPSLIIAALEREPEHLLRDIPTLETAFDNLCVHELKVYAESLDGKVYHYKDSYGTTADSVVRLKDGRWCAFDHVLGPHQIDTAAEKLCRLKRAYADTVDPASFVGVICATVNAVYTRPDGVVVLPITALTP